MAGIYLHIPFCRKACHYCDFHFSTNLKHKDRMLSVISKELIQRSGELTEQIDTIYFGGGTPSLLTGDEISMLLDLVKEHYNCRNRIEITLECNPDDTSLELFEAYYKAGINRLSIGIQSFDDEDLRYLGRIHQADQAHECIEQAQSAGIKNISSDIIYGIPGSKNQTIIDNLGHYFDYGIPHISAYALTIEPKTYLSHAIEKGKIRGVNEDFQNRQFYQIRKELQSAGFEHYEMSNYCLPTYISQHNSNYWQRINYLGIGPSAHSYVQGKRRWNISNNGRYMRAIESGGSFYEMETLDSISTYNEKILVGLRIMKGLDIGELGQFENHFLRQSKKFLDKGWLEFQNSNCRVSEEGMIWLDHISQDLFYVE